jgi:flavin reductase (DIM6/NTAB) family NADH-FMN oxidoreductase RutF
MRLLANGVCIVGAAWEGERGGMTATAVCSLALSPPRLLACVNMGGHTYGMIDKSRCISVNVLAQDQEHLARRFAGLQSQPRVDRFSEGEWTNRVTGSPLLSGALAALDCRVTNIVPAGSHAIVIATVEDILLGPRRAPLIHFESGFTSILSFLPDTAS